VSGRDIVILLWFSAVGVVGVSTLPPKIAGHGHISTWSEGNCVSERFPAGTMIDFAGGLHYTDLRVKPSLLAER
jgi:hypothetical protein